jgi:FdhD protein
MGRITSRRRVLRIREGARDERADTVVVEEPLEIRVGGRAVAVTMRTPGDDFDLVRGFLLSEGVITGPEEVTALRYCAPVRAAGDGGYDAYDGHDSAYDKHDSANNGYDSAYDGHDSAYNVVDAVLAPGVASPHPSIERAFYTTSSCGICGKASLDAVRTSSRWRPAEDPVQVSEAVLATLPERLRAGQAVFERTGGLHAAGLFAADGELLCLREDVGRHNAVDKVLGWALGGGRLPLSGTVLQVSGRASFELVQKAVMAGVPVLAAVSAPSSLAVDLAADAGLTLVGFLRGRSMNVYACASRVVASAAAR